jgi:hypothetical protein
MKTTDKINEMIASLNKWLKSIDYNYYEYSYVPDKLYSKYHWINNFWRLFFRLSIFNLRGKKTLYPIAPQSLVALLKAYNLLKDTDAISVLLPRLLSLKSVKTKNFALSQGIPIVSSFYKYESSDPAPLNTVWFGQIILDDKSSIFDEKGQKELLLSISNYLIDELGYIDFKEEGIYFHYAPAVKKEIYNASALMSAFLLRVGSKYNIESYKKFGELGIQYVINNQNTNGSWYYMKGKKNIDNFHHAYILQALLQSKDYISFSIEDNLIRGIQYYRDTMFKYKKEYVIPVRYDKKSSIPLNTWFLQKIDGRDLAEALIFFSKYIYDKKMLDGLISYMYKKMYIHKKGYFVSEILLYGKNKIPYLEFQAWYLYALVEVLQKL